MSKIKITRSHCLGIEGARAEAERIARRMQDEYGASYAWDGDTMRFSGSGVRGTIAITDNKLDLTIWLGLLLTAMKAKIEQRLVAKIDRHLARHANGDGSSSALPGKESSDENSGCSGQPSKDHNGRS